VTPPPVQYRLPMDFDGIWSVLDAEVSSGRIPGYVAAVRLGDQAEIRAGGRTAVEPGSPPMTADTQFRIASLTKQIGAALTLLLVQDGVLALDDPISRWLPEMASPRVLVAPDAPLDHVVNASRPVTVRDLLAGTSGWGCVLEPTP
jgi:CubicO group peptidase (beta-lactamase class C family)